MTSSGPDYKKPGQVSLPLHNGPYTISVATNPSISIKNPQHPRQPLHSDMNRFQPVALVNNMTNPGYRQHNLFPNSDAPVYAIHDNMTSLQPLGTHQNQYYFPKPVINSTDYLGAQSGNILEYSKENEKARRENNLKANDRTLGQTLIVGGTKQSDKTMHKNEKEGDGGKKRKRLDNGEDSAKDGNIKEDIANHENCFYVGCKKDGCSGVIAIPKNASHGMGFSCPICMSKQRYCLDCHTIYINFRRHKKRGHELYEFQRKQQVLLRNSNGLFVPGKNTEIDKELLECTIIDNGDGASQEKKVDRKEEEDPSVGNAGLTEIERKDETRNSSTSGIHEAKSETRLSQQDKSSSQIVVPSITLTVPESKDSFDSCGIGGENCISKDIKLRTKSQNDEGVNVSQGDRDIQVKLSCEELLQDEPIQNSASSICTKDMDMKVRKAKGRLKFGKKKDDSHLEMLHMLQKRVLEKRIDIKKMEELLSREQNVILDQRRKMSEIAKRFLHMGQKTPGILHFQDFDWLEAVAKQADLSSDIFKNNQIKIENTNTEAMISDIDKTEYLYGPISSTNINPNSLENSTSSAIEGNKDDTAIMVDGRRTVYQYQNQYTSIPIMKPNVTPIGGTSTYFVAQNHPANISPIFSDQNQHISSYPNISQQHLILPFQDQTLKGNIINQQNTTHPIQQMSVGNSM